jgi:sialidase-1
MLHTFFAKARRFVIVAVGALVAVASPAEEPWLEKTDLFAARDAGFALPRIPGIVVTKRGVVLAYCEARKNSGADWGEIEVHLRRSIDGGRTWGPARQIAHVGPRLPRNPVALAKRAGGPDDQTVNNPVAIADADGTVHFLYCVEYARCFYLRSDDDGATFSAPVEITSAFEKFRPEYAWQVLATGPGHGIQLKNGRLLVTVWLSTGEHGHSPSVAATIFSDDRGATWAAGEIALPDAGELKTPNETAAVQLADGRVMLNARSNSAASRRLVTTSADGATGWMTPWFDPALAEPICMGSLLRLTGSPGGGWLLFANPDSLKRDEQGAEVPGGRGERRNLSLKLSRDSGKTWPVNQVLEAGASAYSDLGQLADGTLLCFYERTNGLMDNGKPRGVLTLARFNIDWLTSSSPDVPQAR